MAKHAFKMGIPIVLRRRLYTGRVVLTFYCLPYTLWPDEWNADNLGYSMWLACLNSKCTSEDALNDGRHFADDIFFKCIFLNENVWIAIKILLNFVLKEGPN